MQLLTPTSTEQVVGAPGLRGLATVMRYVRSTPGATAAADWEWLSEEIADTACAHCSEPLQRWETLNAQVYCSPCDIKLHRPASEEDTAEASRQSRLAAAGVPPVYLRCSQTRWLGSMPPEFAAFTNAPAGCWYIYGDTGRGKTHLAIAALERVLLSAGGWALFRDVPELMAESKRALRPGGDGGERIVRPLRDCRLLVLDDLGAERGTEYEESLLSEVLRYRHSQEKATIVTSNLTPDALRELDPKTASRITSQLRTKLGGADRRVRA